VVATEQSTFRSGRLGAPHDTQRTRHSLPSPISDRVWGCWGDLAETPQEGSWWWPEGCSSALWPRLLYQPYQRLPWLPHPSASWHRVCVETPVLASLLEWEPAPLWDLGVESLLDIKHNRNLMCFGIRAHLVPILPVLSQTTTDANISRPGTGTATVMPGCLLLLCQQLPRWAGKHAIPSHCHAAFHFIVLLSSTLVLPFPHTKPLPNKQSPLKVIFPLWSHFCYCPGFGQDRVNFHQHPGRGIAGWAGPTPTWPNRARYSIPCAVTLGSGGGGAAAGGRRGGNSLAAWERAAPVLSERAGLWVVRFVWCFLLICVIVVPVPFVCCSVKLPLSQPTSFLPVSFHSPPHRGGRRGSRVALLLLAAAETRTFTLAPRRGAGITAGLSSGC